MNDLNKCLTETVEGLESVTFEEETATVQSSVIEHIHNQSRDAEKTVALSNQKKQGGLLKKLFDSNELNHLARPKASRNLTMEKLKNKLESCAESETNDSKVLANTVDKQKATAMITSKNAFKAEKKLPGEAHSKELGKSRTNGDFDNASNYKLVDEIDNTDTEKLREQITCGIETLPSQRVKLNRKKLITYNIMCVGQSGLGKSTFINTLFQSQLMTTTEQNHEKESTSKSAEIEFKTTRICQKTHYLEQDDGMCIRLTCIDTPGFGDYANNQYAWSGITSYINDQYTQYFLQEIQPERKEKTDTRVHCCLYFIPPNNKGLSSLDVEAMREIAQRVTLIPVIAKSDGLLAEETGIFLKNIRETMQKQGIQVCKYLREDLRQDLSVANMEELIPFRVIGSSTKVLNSEKQMVYGRSYKWGTCEVENPEHCDFIKLRNLLISDHLMCFFGLTEEYYATWRANIIFTQSRQSQRLLFSKDLWKQLSHWNPVYNHQERALKEKYDNMTTREFQLLKNKKTILFNRQDALNEDINELRGKIVCLENECADIEALIEITKTEKIAAKVDRHSESGSGNDLKIDASNEFTKLSRTNSFGAVLGSLFHKNPQS
ncbi:hypothetical protein ACO0QE_000140 [Hanseniaspora vineae]